MVEPVAASVWTEAEGQAAVKQLIACAVNPVHAYLFSGPQAFPSVFLDEAAPQPLLRAAARGFAAEVFAASHPEDASEHRSQVLNQTHPNLIFIEPEGRTFRVQEASLVSQAVMTSPKLGMSKKIVVCERFHTAEENAAAKLLKTLEEPPEFSILVLLAEDQVLDTIASRCLKVEFSPVPQQNVLERLLEWGVDADLAPGAAAASQGDLGRAYFLAKSGNFEDRAEAWREVPSSLNGTGTKVVAEVVKVQDLLGELLADTEELLKGDLDAKAEANLKREKRKLKDAELKFGFAILASCYRDLALKGGAESMACIEAAEHISQASKDLAHNPDENLLLTDLFFKLPVLSGG